MSPTQEIPHKILECLKSILIVELWLIVMFGRYVILSERLDFCPHTVLRNLWVLKINMIERHNQNIYLLLKLPYIEVILRRIICTKTDNLNEKLGKGKQIISIWFLWTCCLIILFSRAFLRAVRDTPLLAPMMNCNDYDDE